jgi:hypothetical protein
MALADFSRRLATGCSGAGSARTVFSRALAIRSSALVGA